MKKTLQDQYLLIKEGKGHKGVFLTEAKREFPHIVRTAATFEEAVASLKTKNIISENIFSVMPAIMDRPKKESYETAFEAFLAEAKKSKEEEDEKVKAEEKKVSKHVEEDLEKNFDNSDNKNPDNMIFDQIMMGYYAEMKDPKNADKTMQQLKDIVFKNLAKDPIYYTKDGQFGIKGLGYSVDHPGLGEPKEAKGKYKSSGFGDLKENKDLEREARVMLSRISGISPTMLKDYTKEELKDALKKASKERFGKIELDKLADQLEETKCGYGDLKESINEVIYNDPQPNPLKDLTKMLVDAEINAELRGHKFDFIIVDNDKYEISLQDGMYRIRDLSKAGSPILKDYKLPEEVVNYFKNLKSSSSSLPIEYRPFHRHPDPDSDLEETKLREVIREMIEGEIEEMRHIGSMFQSKLGDNKKERQERDTPSSPQSQKIPSLVVKKLERRGLKMEDGVIKMPKLLQIQIQERPKQIDFIYDLKLNRATYPKYNALADPANYITYDTNHYKFKNATLNDDGSITIKQSTPLKESVEKDLADINKEAEHEVLQSKLDKIDVLIDKRKAQLSKLDEDEDMKALTDKKKVKEIEKDIKKLEVARNKVEKMMSKFKGKKSKDKEVIDEVEGDEELPLETPSEASAEYLQYKEDAENRYNEGESIDSILSTYTNISLDMKNMLRNDLEGKMDGMDY